MTSSITFHSWIHHDSQTSTTKGNSSTKSQVFRHVAAHRKLKRQQRTLKLRASALNVLKTLQVPLKLENQLSGSGDPFDALPILVTPEISDLIHFDDLHITPATRDSKIKLCPASTYLHDELAIYGYLARVAAIKAKCCNDEGAYNLMFKMKAEAMRQLRLNLHLTSPTRLPRPVTVLMYTENWCDNIQAVRIHMHVLKAIYNHYGLNPDDLICVLSSDVQRASLILDTTLFAMEDETYDTLGLDYSPKITADVESDTNISSTVLELLGEMRKALVALDTLQAPQATQADQQGATIKCLQTMGHFLNHYNLARDPVEKYVALAALYRIRCEAKVERRPLCSRTIFNSGKIIIPRMRDLLITTSGDYPELRLWALSVGMMSGDSWVTNEFKRQFDALALLDLEDLAKIIRKFEHRDPSQEMSALLSQALSSEDSEVSEAV